MLAAAPAMTLAAPRMTNHQKGIDRPMFGSRKRHLLSDGAPAVAVLTDVSYAKLAGIAVASNSNYKPR